MTRRVVTIARTLGSGGEDVGHRVAKEMKLRYADDEIIIEAAERAGVAKESVERAEHPPGLIARILDTMGSVPLDPQVYYGQALTLAPVASRGTGYDELIQKVILETASRGDVVIVAHGAGICLADAPNVLRVLVTAPDDVRAQRLVALAGMDSKAAQKAIEQSDRERREFLRRFYGLQDERPSNYDLVVNTERLSVDSAAALVAAGVRS